ncbi:endolytic transglycosylase MltG [Pseudolactococcus paracarnosus]|uniref:Endolytic murein transglycosylase n=1 Tax=Pseudolactococcus paracarnosus TaxID=2749962 RepID=A0A7L4WDI2_9LACT|nr:endolytic transglycosylase MltG [Lactococcus paracarnosus]SPC36550.1 Protein YceG like [Lactococcus piscium]MCJ1977923.1 endolytic transglycosylase MltG [Lactococcus paracarnosus]MCJ1984066.1 endolytic transglycosylase MltG [Lactococcus paracarnosus]MCJ1994175.1 endolytic transglycosylase MltG [Lactococcus paracarnosus]MCJ1997879.1 endolytic transglycosylase MltG [Lactococcus paracarnosus]
MEDKDTQSFERENFKEKILRQLAAGNQSLEDLESETVFSDEQHERNSDVNLFADQMRLGKKAAEDAVHHEQVMHINQVSDTELEEELMAANSEYEQAYEPNILFSQTPDELSAPPFPERMSDVTPQKSQIQERQTQENLKRSAKKNSKKLAGKIIASIVLILFIVGGATAYFGYRYYKSEVQPYNLKDTTVKAINIPKGASSKDIGIILEKDKIIKNAALFKYYTKLNSFTDFKSGYYNLSPNMSLPAIAKTLQKGGTDKPVAPILGKVTIPEGYTIDQMSDKILENADSSKSKTPFTKAAFLKVVTDPAFIDKMKATYPDLLGDLPDKASGVKYQLEGYLFPATYEYTKNSTVSTVVEEMIAAMNQNMQPYYDKIKSMSPITVNEILSIAALTEKEANNDADRRNVAQVFYNRINSGMTLGSNISILYAEGKLGQKTTLADDAAVDTSLDSPFNLYTNLGFGPGPVASPSLSAIKAAVEPTDNNDLYFVADVTTGKVYFSETIAEHNANVKKYVNDKLSSESTNKSHE